MRDDGVARMERAGEFERIQIRSKREKGSALLGARNTHGGSLAPFRVSSHPRQKREDTRKLKRRGKGAELRLCHSRCLRACFIYISLVATSPTEHYWRASEREENERKRRSGEACQHGQPGYKPGHLTCNDA